MASSGICEHCNLFAAQMERHLHEEHGVKFSDERAKELRDEQLAESRRRTQEEKDSMVYVGDGPIQPK